MLLQELAVIRQLRRIVLLNFFQRIRQRHFPEPMVMTIALAVRGNMNQLIELPSSREPAHQPVGKTLAITEQPFESYRLRDRSIIEKQRKAFFRWQFGKIRMSGIDLRFRNIVIPAAALAAHPLGLA